MPSPIPALNEALEGRYCIERELGQGGMATVYLADDLRHERKVALKVVNPELAARVGAERFLSEIKTTANLQHPHILPLFDSGEVDGLLFYVMPYVRGESLRERLDREKQLPVDEALRITTGIASALHYAHQEGVVHRDVKPANVMLSDGIPMVADFGVALAVESAGDGRLTGTGLSVGTPQYVSPEQATGQGDIDARSDLYALACVLYELLTGEPPHTGSTPQAILAKRLTVPPTSVRAVRRTVTDEVDRAVRRALEVVPADRYPTLEAFSRAINGGQTPEPFPQLRLHPEPVAAVETPFVAREKERAELLERLGWLAEGRGSLVLLGGEPGVGKTRLSEFVLEEARRRGHMCVTGHAYELEGTPPFTPLVEQLEYTARVAPPESFRAVLGDAAPEIARIWPGLRGLFPDIPPGIDLPADQLRQHMFHRYREFVERASRVSPLVALFDDLHWADEGSLLLLEHLAHHLHSMPMLVIGTYRDVELEVGRPFAASLERLLRGHRAHRIALRRLAESEVGDLLEALGGSPPPRALVDLLFHETEGNPFFVQEVFRHLSEEGRLFDTAGAWRSNLSADELDVPEGVRLVVGRRLERVSDTCRAVLSTASVIGPRFSLTVLDAIGDTDEDALLDALDEAEAAQLIRPVGGRRDPVYGFTHELIRQTLIERLSLPRRQRRHFKIADAMEGVFGNRVDDHAADLAHHLYQAGAAADPDKTLRFLKLAGDQALEGSGYEEALAQYERALSLEEDVPAALVPTLLEGRAKALDGMGRWSDLIDCGRRAIELYADMGDPEGMARVSILVSNRMVWRTQTAEARVIADAALAALPDTPTPTRVRLLANLGWALTVEDPERGGEVALEALAAAEELGDPALRIHALMGLEVVNHVRGRGADTVRIADEMLAIMDRANDQTMRAQAVGIRTWWLPWLGRFDEALAGSEEVRRLGRERGHVAAEMLGTWAPSFVETLRLGDGKRLEAWALEAADSFYEAGPWAPYGFVWASLGRLWQGDLGGATDLLDRGISMIVDRSISGMPGGWRFRLAAYAAHPQALEFYRAALPKLHRVGEITWLGDMIALPSVVEGLALLGERDVAAGHYQDVVDALGIGPPSFLDGVMACSAGIAAACGGKWEVADGHFAAALEQAESIPHVMAQFDVRRWWGWAFLSRGRAEDRARAHELLSRAIAGYRKLEAPLFEGIATGLLERGRG